MARRNTFLISNLFRLLGLFRHRHWVELFAWHPSAMELSYAVPEYGPAGILAALAYQPVDLDPRLSLYPAWWWTRKPCPHGPCSPGYNVDRRVVARCQLDLCGL